MFFFCFSRQLTWLDLTHKHCVTWGRWQFKSQLSIFFLSLAGFLGVCLMHVWFRFSQRFGQSLELHLSSSLFAGILPSLSSIFWFLRQNWWWATRIWWSCAIRWLWLALEAKLKNWEARQALDSLQVCIPPQNLPASLHSPEPSGYYFLCRVYHYYQWAWWWLNHLLFLTGRGT